MSSEVKDFIKTHIVHLPMYLTLGAILLCGGWFVHHELVTYEATISTANARYATLVQEVEEDRKTWATNLSVRGTDQKQVQIIDHVVTLRDQVTAAKVAAVVDPSKTTTDIMKDAQDQLHMSLTSESDGNIGFRPPDVQQIVSTSLQAETLKADNIDLSQQLSITKTDLDSAETDLKKSQADLDAAQASAKSYKKLVVKSKWRKALDVGEKLGLFAGGIYLGSKL